MPLKSFSLLLTFFEIVKIFFASWSAAVSAFGQSMQIVLAALLVALAIVVVIACCKKLFGKEEPAKA